MLLAGTISHRICIGDGPTEGRHKTQVENKRSTERKGRGQRHKAKKAATKPKTKTAFYVQLVG